MLRFVEHTSHDIARTRKTEAATTIGANKPMEDHRACPSRCNELVPDCAARRQQTEREHTDRDKKTERRQQIVKTENDTERAREARERQT